MDTVEWLFLVGVLALLSVFIIVQLALDLKKANRRRDWEFQSHGKTIEAWSQSVEGLGVSWDALKINLAIERRLSELTLECITKPWEGQERQDKGGER